MTATNWVALIGAIIAALFSGAAALLAWASARGARQSADGIDRRRHMIEALDAETESFRSAVAAVYQSMHDVDFKELAIANVRTVARSQMVRLHPLCTPELDRAIVEGNETLDRIEKRMKRAMSGGSYADPESGENETAESLPDMEHPWRNFRIEARNVLEGQAANRRRLLKEIDRARVLEWSISLPFGVHVASKPPRDHTDHAQKQDGS
jgi:hypothetical protein